MPVEYLRTLTAPERTRRTDVHLGLFLAFNAGAINAGGFLAVSQYTSHMTGLVSEMADHLALGDVERQRMQERALRQAEADRIESEHGQSLASRTCAKAATLAKMIISGKRNGFACALRRLP